MFEIGVARIGLPTVTYTVTVTVHIIVVLFVGEKSCTFFLQLLLAVFAGT